MTEVWLKCILVLSVLLWILKINGLEIIPERANISYTNPEFVKDVSINVRRYGRKSAYYINIQGTTQQTWANNITVEFIFYEFLHNEYKRSFIEMKYKLCDLINKDIYVGPLLRELKFKCPLPAGIQRMPNMTLKSIPAVDNLPYKWPFEKGKIQAEIRTYPGGVLVADGYGIATFKQTKKKNK